MNNDENGHHKSDDPRAPQEILDLEQKFLQENTPDFYHVEVLIIQPSEAKNLVHQK
jgi:hypothetical protein